MTEDEFRDRFRGSAIRRAKRSGLRRNAVIAMGNTGDQRFESQLQKLKLDEDPVVAESAGWAAKRLKIESPRNA
jgi:epoxyqueuosine reductase